MATPILLVCPECGKQIKAPENVLGKKVRCKFCQASFVAKKGNDKPSSVTAKKPGGKPAKSPPATPAPAKPAKPVHEDEEEEDANPYGLIDVSLSARCPDCANEMEEGAIICLICGYNTQTRERAKTRKVYDLTLGEHILWLLPGIVCAVTVFSVIGFNIWYLMKISDVTEGSDNFFVWMWAVGGIKLWVVIMSLGVIWFAGKFAVKRLIIHPKPPEVEKLK